MHLAVSFHACSHCKPFIVRFPSRLPITFPPCSRHVHNSAHLADDWLDIPLADLAVHGPLYDSIYENDREIVVLAQFPMLDTNKRERPVYTEDGQRVALRLARLYPGRGQCAILVDLDNIRDMFDQPDGDDDMSDFESSPQPHTVVNAYRQGFLKSAGHIQANNVPHDLKLILNDINSIVAHDAAPQPNDEGSDDGQHVPHPMPALFGVDCQMYNTVMHHVRGTANTHDAQCGDVTAALAGTYSEGATQRKTAKRLKDSCTTRLPHENYRLIIDHPDLDTSLRIENVFLIDLLLLKDDM